MRAEWRQAISRKPSCLIWNPISANTRQPSGDWMFAQQTRHKIVPIWFRRLSSVSLIISRSGKCFFGANSSASGADPKVVAPQIVMARELNNANAAKRFSHMSIYSRLQVATAPVTEELCCKRAISDGMSKLASSACIS